MNILMKMYQGSYVINPNNIGHERINLIKADDGKFYIWLNSNGSFNKDTKESINIIMVRTISEGVYSVIAKAIDCKPVIGCNHLENKKNERRKTQDKITYKGKRLIDIYSNENNNVVTFVTDQVYKAKTGIYVTNDDSFVDNIKYYKLEVTMKSSMRQYFDKDRKKKKDFDSLIKNKKIWEETVSREKVSDFIKKYNNIFNDKETMYSILKKESDECSISNSLSYFLKKYNLTNKFLNNLKNVFNKKEIFEIYREKNDMDLFFISDSHIVVIENKIYSDINGKSSKKSLSKQLKSFFKDDFLLQIFEDYDNKKSKKQIDNIKNELEEEAKKIEIKNKNLSVSQLSKYYFISQLIAKNKRIKSENIYYFLLIPNFNGVVFKNKLIKNLFFAEKYEIIYYDAIYKFFSNIYTKYHDIYLEDFIDEIRKYSNDLDCSYESNLAKTLKQCFEE